MDWCFEFVKNNPINDFYPFFNEKFTNNSLLISFFWQYVFLL